MEKLAFVCEDGIFQLSEGSTENWWWSRTEVAFRGHRKIIEMFKEVPLFTGLESFETTAGTL